MIRLCPWCDASFRSVGAAHRYCVGCRPLVERVRRSVYLKLRRAIQRKIIPKIKRGVICVDCGGQAEHYDHRDYSKPFDVQSVCRICNYKRGPAISYLNKAKANGIKAVRPEGS